VEPGKPLSYGQIYDSNSAMLAGAIREAGAQPFMTRAVADDPDALRHEVMSHLATADAFVSTGGVSVGERDPVKAAFQGREVEFFRVAMQPGMPQGFGLLEGKPFFALPGNPVSVFVSFEVFVRPVLTKMMSRAAMHRRVGVIDLPVGKRLARFHQFVSGGDHDDARAGEHRRAGESCRREHPELRSAKAATRRRQHIADAGILARRSDMTTLGNGFFDRHRVVGGMRLFDGDDRVGPLGDRRTGGDTDGFPCSHGHVGAMTDHHPADDPEERR
jgi:molybdenum cofactor synthesis domain-containing protein